MSSVGSGLRRGDMSGLRQKLDNVTLELAAMTRALGRLAVNLPRYLEPCPSEVDDAALLLGTGTKADLGSGPPFVISDVLTERGAEARLAVTRGSAPLIIHSQRCLQHRVDEGAQEHGGRLQALLGPSGVLTQEPLRSQVMWEHWDHEASLTDILRVHEWDYVSQLMKRCRELQELQDASSNAEHPSPPPISSLDIDTNICADSFTAAAVAAGAACRAVDRVATSQIAPRRVFVAVRPPGHHAGPRGRVLGPDGEAVSSSQGFCLLNSVAIAAAYARYNYRGLLRRIAMVDFDVHYGDGTAACVLNLVPGTHHVSAGHGVRVSMPCYKPWLDQTDPNEVPPVAIV